MPSNMAPPPVNTPLMELVGPVERSGPIARTLALVRMSRPWLDWLRELVTRLQSAATAITLTTTDPIRIDGGASAVLDANRTLSLATTIPLLRTFSSGIVIQALLRQQSTSPAQITANQDNYAPATRHPVWRLSTDATRTFSGFSGGTADELIVIVNVGTQIISLLDQNAGSSATNRIITGIGGSLIVRADQAVALYYDNTTTRWRVLSRSAAIRELNGLSGDAQTLVVGASGTDFNIAASGTVHTFHIPDAGPTARGLITSSAQTIAGAKGFQDGVAADAYLEATERLQLGIASPAQITASQNNYSPGVSRPFLRLNTDASRDITGFDSTVLGGLIFITNVGSFDIVYKHQNASSSVGNRITTLSGGDFTQVSGATTLFMYDATSLAWRQV